MLLFEAEPVGYGIVGGLVASVAMYGLLFPVARGAPLPPERFALIFLKTESLAWRRLLGLDVQLLFGIFWGAVFGYAGANGFVPGDSLPVLGICVGLAAFALSLIGFRVLGLLETPFDRRAWAGHFLNHVVFGVTMGLVFLWLT